MSVITAHPIQSRKSPQPHVLFSQRVGQSGDPTLGHHDFYGRPKVSNASVSGSPLPTFSGARPAWLAALKQCTTQHAENTFAWLQRQQQASVKTLAHAYHGVQRVDPHKSAQAVLMSGVAFVLWHQVGGGFVHNAAETVSYVTGHWGGAATETLLECVTASLLGQKLVGKKITRFDTLICGLTSFGAHLFHIPEMATEWVLHGGHTSVHTFGQHLHHHDGWGASALHYVTACFVPNTVGDWCVSRFKKPFKQFKSTLQEFGALLKQPDLNEMAPIVHELEEVFSRGAYRRPEPSVSSVATPTVMP